LPCNDSSPCRTLALRRPRAPARGRSWRVRAIAILVLLGGTNVAMAWQAEAMSRTAARFGPRVQAGLAPLQSMLAGLPNVDAGERLRRVNLFFNQRVAYRPDSEVWGEIDHWASPLEMLDRAAGDCEDFAIAKYLSLVGTGMPVERLRLVYVRARTGTPGEPAAGSPHMVLAYFARPRADPLILDNLGGHILPASQRPDLWPVFSFNAYGLWQGVGNIRAGNPLQRLTPWLAVLQRAHAEGFL